ncbi:MAG: hypothetical protein GQ532_18010 [Methylomarinum sp.]|nr:hypothetical protein [Methylomarinum sp.]
MPNIVASSDLSICLLPLLAAWVMGMYADTMKKTVVLSVPMPVISSMSGFAGNQPLTQTLHRPGIYPARSTAVILTTVTNVVRVMDFLRLTTQFLL